MHPAAQYYVLDGKGRKVHVNSHFTIGEDVADAGGLAQALLAWRDRFAADPAGDRFDNYLLPGLNYTREQLLFVAYARGWARNLKPQEAVRCARSDVRVRSNTVEHAHRRIRIDPHR
jgi:endothelin-converting enzyme